MTMANVLHIPVRMPVCSHGQEDETFSFYMHKAVTVTIISLANSDYVYMQSIFGLRSIFWFLKHSE